MTAVAKPVVPTTTSPSSGSPASARSAVRQPSSRAAPTAASTASAASARPSEVRSSIAADRIVPIGLAMSWPAMSGAEPWIGSYSPNVPCVGPPLAERGRRQHAEAPGEHGRLVGQDVAEQVLGDDDVEVGRPPDEQHRARIDQLVAEPRRPGTRPRSRRRRVRHRRDVARTLALSTWVSALRAGPGQLEREPDDPARSRARRTAACRARSAPRARPTPRVRSPK